MYSLWRAIETTGVLLWGALILAQAKRDGSPRRLFDSFYIMSLVMLMGVIVTVVRNPEHVWMMEGKGVQRLDINSGFLMGANSIGVTAALLSLAMIARLIISPKAQYIVLLSISLGLCYAARSRTGFVILAFGLVLIIAYSIRLAGRRWAVIGTTFLGLLLSIGLIIVSPEFMDSITHTFTRGQDQKNLASLDGRVSIWGTALKAFHGAPFVGSGYGTYPAWVSAIGHFHNVYIEIMVTMGIVGLIPILILTSVLATRIVGVWLRAPDGTTMHQLASLDALLFGITLILSDMTTAGAAYYSWQLIGMVVLSVGIQSIRAYTFNDTTEDQYASMTFPRTPLQENPHPLRMTYK